jgi:4-diphosphocytidyl-2-C-methyl-D-erythritol kinase
MISFPPCKINIGLNVRSKRGDGYHDIETCFYPVQWTDILEIIPSETLAFTCSGLSIPGNSNDNLCLKAYESLRKDFSLAPVKIHLHKVIPTGAGLGGGSSNAAHTLRLLNSIFNLKLKEDQLRKYATQLGSDCAFFIEDSPMIGMGRGEMLNRIQLKLNGKFIVLVKPDVHVSTAEAYEGIKPRPNAENLNDVLTKNTLSVWKDSVKNDFEESVFKKHPLINEIKSKLYQQGASYASMSGSGSAVYGIFEKPVDLKDQFQNSTYWSGTLS